MLTNNKPTIAVCITSRAASYEEYKLAGDAVMALSPYFNVRIYENVLANDIFDSMSVSERIRSINWCADKGDIIMPWTGGFNAIELLHKFEDIRISGSKIFVGYSDNTILTNAFPATKVCRGWQGPMFANWVKNPIQRERWTRSLLALYKNDFRELTELYSLGEINVYKPGTMIGPVWGGNNYTFDLLQGSRYFPRLNKPFILLLEGEDLIVDKTRVWQDFVRNLDSIMLVPGAKSNITGLLIGRFPDSYKLNAAEAAESFKKRDYLRNIPIVYNLPRGYADDQLYLPIGEPIRINAEPGGRITINKI